MSIEKLIIGGCAGAVLGFGLLASVVFAQPNKDVQISVVNVDRIKGNVIAGQSTSLTVRIVSTGATAHAADVIVELVGPSGQAVYSAEYPHQTLPESVFESYQLNSGPLSAGTYIIELMVNNPNGSTLASFTNLGTIVAQ